ncbi:MAG TPA: M23 family metallopeptidase [Anaerovoracaceae bacterium]|nr:M23 family metallopeptidase [Anaerovoracaceae bacterium]
MFRKRKVFPRRRRNLRKNLIRQVFICILILLIVILVKKMDTAVVQSTYDLVKGQFARHITLTDIGGGLKSTVGKFKDGTVTVIASLTGGDKGINFATPADIPGTFSASTSGVKNPGKTVEFFSEKEIQVYAAAGGIISEIGKDIEGNNYIKIYHGNEISSIYGGCTSTYVQALEKVKKGQLIASVSAGDGHVLRFEIWNNGKLTDPSEYINFE